MSILIKNATVLDTKDALGVSENTDVFVKDGKIEEVGKNLDVKADETVDASGKILIPGNVCSHHHYYSALSRGMQIRAGAQTDLIQILSEWWWRLDRGLDDEALYYSSLTASMDAIASGTTGVVDHHASPSFIKGSLSLIAKGMEEVGIRGATCYEVTDRNRGMDEVKDGVEENIRFAKEGRKTVGAMIGGHAPFTIPDKGLEMIKEAMNETGCGMHLHTAEGSFDQEHSHLVYKKDIVKRLDKFGLLNEKTMLVHGIFLSEEEVDILNDRGCFFAHNARSNMNNQLGYNTKLPRIKKLVLGTDGCGGDMFEEMKIAFLKHRDAKGPWWPDDFLKAEVRGNELLESIFNKKIKLGKVKKGYEADLVLLSYKAPTPIVKKNIASHFIWGMSSGAVDTVMVGGKIVFKERKFTNLDADKIYAEARRVAEDLWKRTDKIKA